jgi:hypothetical protein
MSLITRFIYIITRGYNYNMRQRVLFFKTTVIFLRTSIEGQHDLAFACSHGTEVLIVAHTGFRIDPPTPNAWASTNVFSIQNSVLVIFTPHS